MLTSQTDFGALLDQTTMGPTINEMAGIKDPPVHHLLHRAAALFDFNELDRVQHEPGPKFVMMHILLPHEPYVFAANGEYSGLNEYDSKFCRPACGNSSSSPTTRSEASSTASWVGRRRRVRIVIIEADEGP